MSALLDNILEAGLTQIVRQAFMDDLTRGFRAQLALANERQARIARAMRADGGRVHVAGLGEQRACIDPYIYFEMERRHGKGCWKDPAFLRRMLADEPALKVQCRARNATVRVPGL